MNIKESKIFRPACESSSEEVNYNLTIDEDLTDLLPYINREIDNAKYNAKGSFIKFMHNGHKVVLNQNTVSIAKFTDNDEAEKFSSELLLFLDDIRSRKGSIEPDYTTFDPPSVIELLKLLPRKAPCKECGYPACMAFATALRQGEAEPEACTVLAGQPDGEEKLEKIRELLGR
ncbi:MAG: hypothetical protein GXP49_16890 [Deltaproteobacteria bacterium]|nr:hypothetical protein [Deltaproteobacteria bacterium]